jgi:hypothetical protein
MLKIQKGKTTPIRTAMAVAIIGIVTALMILTVPVSKPAYAQVTVGGTAKEQVVGIGIGTLTCSNGLSFPSTQINFNAIVPYQPPGKPGGPATGSMALTTSNGIQTQGTILAGGWHPMERAYTASGTTTTDNVCGIPGSPFTISGIIGPDVPITMGGDKYSFQGIGNVQASPAKKA